MREHKRMLFLGNGDHSRKEMDKLRARFDKALMLNGGMQQGPIRDYMKKDVEEVFNIAKDIFVALTGHEVVEHKEVP